MNRRDKIDQLSKGRWARPYQLDSPLAYFLSTPAIAGALDALRVLALCALGAAMLAFCVWSAACIVDHVAADPDPLIPLSPRSHAH